MNNMPGIKLRLFLLGIAPAVMIGLALTAYFVHTRFLDLELGLRQRGDLIARQLAAAAAEGLLADNRRFLRDLAQATLKEKDVMEVNIISEFEPLMALPETGATQTHHAAERLVCVQPIRLAQEADGPAAQALGYVRVVLSRRDTLASQREAISYSLGILLSGVLLAAGVARRISRKISSPLLSLTHAVHELSKGQMRARANAEAEGELAYLQAGFNAMASELEKHQQNLEQQMRQATARLQEALESLERRNRELERARVAAETQTDLKSQFLAQMSHEIRTPMNGVIGFAELLAQTPLTQEQSEKLGLIERSAKNLLAILNEILSLSKLEAGNITLNLRQFNLRSNLEDTISLLSVRSPHLPIILWIEPSVPKNIIGDPIRIQQVMSNLIGNALKFTRRGRILARVRVLSCEQGERLLFSVSDSGPGISPEDINRLFSPFQQLSAQGLHYERGAGLGLSIAKNIVEKMSGRIHVASRLHKGTTFWFSLPLAVGLNEFSQASQYAAALVSADPAMRQALRFQLEALGARATVFGALEDFLPSCSNSAQGSIVVIEAGSLPEKKAAALRQTLAQCAASGIDVILILPDGEQSWVKHYREKGCCCLFLPVRSESLRAIFRKLASSGEAQGMVSPLASTATAMPESAQHILVADDNEINRLLLRSQLSRFNAQISQAADGGEALEKLSTQAFDLVLMDLQMPVYDGHAVLRQVREGNGPNRNTPIIAITAYTQPGQKEELLLSGFTACLIKPILEEQLVGLVKARFAHNAQPFSPPGENTPHDVYARALLEKTQGDRRLASVIAVKLFQEFPEYLGDMEAALSQGDRDKARRIAHKMHGAAGFCGLQDIRVAAADFESALLKQEPESILRNLRQILTAETERFLSHQAGIMESLSLPPQLPDNEGSAANEKSSGLSRLCDPNA
jgi:two-component system sensor histidine kinase BarA